MSLFLTETELRELTELEQPEAQRRWLTSRGWAFEVSAKGRNRVLRAVMERMMGAAGRARQSTEPDFGAIKKAS